MDWDNSGEIDYTEFLIASFDLNVYDKNTKEKAIKEAFNSLKMSNENYIYYQNLLKSFTKYGISLEND